MVTLDFEAAAVSYSYDVPNILILLVATAVALAAMSVWKGAALNTTGRRLGSAAAWALWFEMLALTGMALPYEGISQVSQSAAWMMQIIASGFLMAFVMHMLITNADEFSLVADMPSWAVILMSATISIVAAWVVCYAILPILIYGSGIGVPSWLVMEPWEYALARGLFE